MTALTVHHTRPVGSRRREADRAARPEPPQPGLIFYTLGIAALVVVLHCMADQMKEPLR